VTEPGSAGYGAGSAAAAAAAAATAASAIVTVIARSLSFFPLSYIIHVFFPLSPLILPAFTYHLLYFFMHTLPLRSFSAYHFLIYELLRFILLKMIKLN